MTKPILVLPPPTPMVGPNEPVDWMFAYKFNAGSFPGYLDADFKHQEGKAGLPGRFDGTTKEYKGGMSQNYVYASSKDATMKRGNGALGNSEVDPLSVTFAQVYNTEGYNYVLWNDQFYDNPMRTEGGPFGHSKGMAAWNEEGEGFVLQVSTPSWPASGNHKISRNKKDAKKPDFNTLGCIDDDDIMVAQHFFCLKVTKADLLNVLEGLYNSSVVTDPKIPALCNNSGGPEDIQNAVSKLGKHIETTEVKKFKLSSGITFISKPSSMHVPPWQMVSAQLNTLDLRVVSWWASPAIYSTKAKEIPGCWAPNLGTPGEVEIALTGNWKGRTFSVIGDHFQHSNHAKLGISKDPRRPISIFGDENQQGALKVGYDKSGYYATHTQQCNSSQNGRGGTFYVLEHEEMWQGMTDLFAGESAADSPVLTDMTGIPKES